jgi:YD repeat-containing protein
MKVWDGADGRTLVGLFDLNTRTVIPNTSYDALGDPLAFTIFPDTGDPATSNAPLSAWFVWDAAQQMKEAHLANGSSIINTFQNGLQTKAENFAPGGGLLARTTINYNSVGLPYQYNDLLGTFAQVTYDANGAPTEVVDGGGRSVNISYGARGEVTYVSGTGTGDGSFSYNVAGQTQQTTDSRGQTANYTYDAAGRLTQITLAGHPNETTTFTYDNADRPLTVLKANGDSVVYQYVHPNKWLTAVITTVAGRVHRVEYVYQPDGRPTTMLSYVNGVLKTQESYTYNARGQVESITVPGLGVTNITYDFAGRFLSQVTTSPSGTSIGTTHTYSVSGQAGDPSTAPAYLRTVTNTVNGAPVETYTLTHSYLGQLLSVSSSNQIYNYSYDLRGRLNGETRQRLEGSSVYNGASVYTYDGSDNLNADVNGWQYDWLNNVTSAPPAGGMPGISGSIGYNSGYLTYINGKTITYDAWGNVAQIVYRDPNNPWGTPYRTVTFRYDALGRQASRTVSGSASPYRTNYDYDGSLIIGEETQPVGGRTIIQVNVDLIGALPDTFARLNSIAVGKGDSAESQPLSAETLSSGAWLLSPDANASSNDLRAVLLNLWPVTVAQSAPPYGYTSYHASNNYVIGAVQNGAATYNQYNVNGTVWRVYNNGGNVYYQQVSHNNDAFGNRQEMTPGLPIPPAYPPTPFHTNGSYHNPDLGDEMDQLGQSASYGQFLGRSGRMGVNELRKLPSWQPGSPERQFESNAVSMIPGVGQAYTAYTVFGGYDPIAGRCLSKGERIFSGLTLGLGNLGGAGRPGGRGGRISGGAAQNPQSSIVSHAVAPSAESAFARPVLPGSPNSVMRPLARQATAGWAGAYEFHHIFPQAEEFAQHWARTGIDIHDFTYPIPRNIHQRWMHGANGGWWNDQWRAFFRRNPNANREQIFAQGKRMADQWGNIDLNRLFRYPYAP